MRGEVVGVVASTAAIEAFYASSGSLPQNINWASKSDYLRLMFTPPTIDKRAEKIGKVAHRFHSHLDLVGRFDFGRLLWF